MIGNQNYHMNSEEKKFPFMRILFDRNTLLFSFPVSFPPCQKGKTPTIPQVGKKPNFKWYKPYKNIIKETPIIRLSFKKNAKIHLAYYGNKFKWIKYRCIYKLYMYLLCRAMLDLIYTWMILKKLRVFNMDPKHIKWDTS